MRLFYAIKVPADLSAELAGSQKMLRGNWRPVRPDQLHVTLAYLPSVQEADLPHLRDLGVQIARDLPPITLRLKGTGFFPNEGSPRVWFVKVESPQTDDLAARLREGLRVEHDDKAFRAHVTLARKKGPAPRLAPQVWDREWTTDRFVLYQSVLHKTGPEYKAVSTFKLRGEQEETGQNRES